jgi:hypothetical protein
MFRWGTLLIVMNIDQLPGETHDENRQFHNYGRIAHFAGGLGCRDSVLPIVGHQNYQLGSHVSLHGAGHFAIIELTYL